MKPGISHKDLVCCIEIKQPLAILILHYKIAPANDSCTCTCMSAHWNCPKQSSSCSEGQQRLWTVNGACSRKSHMAQWLQKRIRRVSRHIHRNDGSIRYMYMYSVYEIYYGYSRFTQRWVKYTSCSLPSEKDMRLRAIATPCTLEENYNPEWRMSVKWISVTSYIV